MEIPAGLVDAERVKKALTFVYQPLGSDEPLEVKGYRLLKSGTLCVPRQFGIQLCAKEGIEYVDATSLGVPIKFPRTPKPRDYQVEPLEDITECAKNYFDFIFRARTGWGKTIGSLIVAGRLGVNFIIIVDQENLKDQWISSLKEHFGLLDSDIGVIQGNRCDYVGKIATIAMVQTLTQRVFPQAMYDHFGTLLVDEVHIIGAPTFSSVLLRFSAVFRFGVSATPKRRDGLQKVLDYNLGKVRIWIEDEHEESAVYIMRHGSVYSEYANRAPKMGRFINEVSEDAARNLALAEAAAYLYDTGRDTLALSDRIEHLRHVMSLCYYLGIPEEEMGVYAGYQLSYRFAKDPIPPRRPVGLERGAEYTPISLQLISKKSRKPDLEVTKTQAHLIFSTYGKFSKGVDEPRLGAGMDLTPRSTSEQVQGRILRKVDGKKRPIWITVADIFSYRSLFALTGRMLDYLKNNAVLNEWSLETGKRKCNPKELRRDTFELIESLKSSQIETNSVGLNTVVTRQALMQRERVRATATTTAIARPRSSRMASSSEVKRGR